MICGAELCPYWPGEGCLRAVMPCGDLVSDGFGGYISPERAQGRNGECSYRDCADPWHRDDDEDGQDE